MTSRQGKAVFTVEGAGEVEVAFTSVKELEDKVDVLVTEQWPNVPLCKEIQYSVVGE